MNAVEELQKPIQSVMTTVPIVEAQDSVETAIRVFQTSPLKILSVTRNGQLAGIITANDMVKLYELAPHADAKVEQLATPDPIAVKSNAQVGELLQVMNGGNPRGLWLNEVPIVDEAYRPIGIVTRGAIASVLP
jgi:predicted transcriptional regulator